MDIDAEMRRKIIVSVATVGLFVALVIGVGSIYSTDQVLEPTGGYALVGVLGGFVVLMAAVGLYLNRQ